MPIYDYKCEECGHVVEKFFSISQKPQTLEQGCPECGDHTVFQTILTGTPGIVGGVGGFKVPEDFASHLKRLKKHYPAMESSVTG